MSRSAAAARDELAPLVAQPRDETPLPKMQLAILCLVRLAEPIAYTQIFPYVNRMMDWLHVTDDPRQIGFYSGLVESVFSFAQLLFIFQWGKLSDRIGRKPVILMGALNGKWARCVSWNRHYRSLWIGVEHFTLRAVDFPLAARLLAGGLSGNVAVIQSVVGEITDETNQARAFPLLNLCWNVGCIIGPLLGGTLSEPATRHPELFGNSQFLKDHPFFLPCTASCCLILCSILLGYCAIKETLPSKVQGQTHLKAASAQSPSYGSAEVPVLRAPPSSPPPSIRSLFLDPVVISVTRTYFLLALCGTGFEVLFVLLAYTAIHLGGLSRSPTEIGSALAFGGLIAATVQPFLFPWLTKRVRLKTLYPFFMALYPIVFICLPMLNLIARANLTGPGSDELTTEGTVHLSIGIAVLLILSRAGSLASASNMIYVKHAAPSKEALGSTFGVAQTIASVSRGIGPAVSSSLFALTVEHHLLGGWFVWLVMSVIGCAGVYSAMNVKDGLEIRRRERHIETSESD